MEEKLTYNKPQILATYNENELIGNKEETFDPQWQVGGSLTYSW